MKLKKSWFYYLCVLLAAVGVLYIFVYSFTSVGAGAEYGHLTRGGFLLAIVGVWILLRLLAAISAKVHLENRLSWSKGWVRWLERGVLCIIFVLAAGIRLKVLLEAPEAYLQDYKNYYEIACSLADGTIQRYREYCNDIVAAPQLMGYSYLLTIAFRIFGRGVRAGQYLNLFCSVASMFFLYKAAGKLGGRIARIGALLLYACWPAQIYSTAMLSPENVFLAVVTLCLWVFLEALPREGQEMENGTPGMVLSLLLGVLLAIAAAIREMGVILLLVMLLMLLPFKMKLPAIPKNDIPLMARLMARGWQRCLIILLPYLIITGVIGSKIELEIDRELPAFSIAAGNSLMEEGKELWSGGDVKETLSGLFRKNEQYFKNRDQELASYRKLMDEQEKLSKERYDFLKMVSGVDQMLYTGVVFLSLISLIYLMMKKAGFSLLPAGVFLGLMVMSCVTGERGEYSLLLTGNFILAAAVAIRYTFEEGRENLKNADAEKELENREAELEAYKIALQEQEEEKLAELRKEVYANLFDMERALKEGHIVMTVTPACMEEENSGRD